MTTESKPSFGETMEALFSAQLREVRAIDIGEVVSYSRGQEQATIRPTILNRDGSARTEIQRCSVVFPGAYWDLQEGEYGLLLVCDSDYRRWWRLAEDSEPATRSQHRIGNSTFLPGIRPRGEARDLPADALVLAKPTASGTVRLGDRSATKQVVHDELLSDLDTFLTVLDAWGGTSHLNWAAASAAWTATVTGPLTALQTKIGTGAYQSPSVAVED